MMHAVGQTRLKIYLVGGAVRDGLLDIPVAERDWVVVGGDAGAMQQLGFTAADSQFPVFLHPDSGEEYALARRETKSGDGYRGFEIDAGADVTLLEDLRRRDLTINAMARAADGTLTDPYNGQDDLQHGLLRHVSPAFVEDPLRVIRVARFAAKLGRHGFRVAHETHRLMCRMVDQGAMRELKAERVWREMMKAMSTDQPWRFFEVLHRCGALAQLLPDLAMAMGPAASHQAEPPSPRLAAMQRIAGVTGDASQRLVCALLAAVSDVVHAGKLAKSLRADRVTAKLLRQAVASRALCLRAGGGDLQAVTDLALSWQGLPDTEVEPLLNVCEAQIVDSTVRRLMPPALAACRSVSAAGLRGEGIAGAALGEAIRTARRAAIMAALQGIGRPTHDGNAPPAEKP